MANPKPKTEGPTPTRRANADSKKEGSTLTPAEGRANPYPSVQSFFFEKNLFYNFSCFKFKKFRSLGSLWRHKTPTLKHNYNYNFKPSHPFLWGRVPPYPSFTLGWGLALPFPWAFFFLSFLLFFCCFFFSFVFVFFSFASKD